MDDSETNAKISDSAYSNSCSNSQSRRSSKSTHSGSNSSGSSGYGGKPSTSGYSNNQSESKKKQQTQLETLSGETRKEKESCLAESATIFESPTEDTNDGVQSPSQVLATTEKAPESMDIATSEGSVMNEDLVIYGPTAPSPVNVSMNYVTSRPPTTCLDGFSCIISLHDGVVMYTTSSLSSTLGFPKDMWIGRSFIDFVHPRDRNAFASQISNGLAVPKNLNGTQKEVDPLDTSMSPMVCRLRRYKDLASGFAVKNSVIIYMPFLLKLTFKNVIGAEDKITYVVIQAAPFFSAFKIPNECVLKPVPFIIRHAANGKLEYLDPESMPYLGYLPQDVTDMDALLLYHPCDLLYIRQIYEIIVKEGGMPRSKPYRMMTQNGDYIVLETEWSSFVNPWSKKLEFVIGKHFIAEGPSNPDVFQSPDPIKGWKLSEEEKLKAQILRESILKVLNEALTKPAEMAKQLMSKRCQELATFMKTLLEDQPKVDEEMRLVIQDPEHSYCERDSVMLGGISPHHDYNDSKSGTETPVSYTQLNYNDTLQRYFASNLPYSNEDYNTAIGENILATNEQISNAKECTLQSVGTDNTGESSQLSNDVGSLVPLGNYHPVRLTESRLSKHNVEMEKELVKMHRESRSSSKGDKEKKSNQNRQKKKEHLARCNASFQPTSAGMNITDIHSQGVKRNSKQLESEPGIHKHHCSSPRQARRRLPAPAATLHINPAVTSAPAPTPWTSNSMNNMNGLVFGVGIPQQMSIMSPMVPMPGMFPMQYVPAPAPMQQMTATTTATTTSPSTSGNAMLGSSSIGQYQMPPMQCMMYGQAMYGTPFMYSPVGPQIPYPIQQSYMPHSVQYVNNPNQLNPLGLTSSNYVEACKSSLPRKPTNVRIGSARQDGRKNRAEAQVESCKAAPHSLISNSSVNESQPSTDAVQDQNNKAKAMRLGNSDDTIDRTDGESSYSSFYSSFFRTESGSAEEISDAKKIPNKNENKNQIEATSAKAFDSQAAKNNVPRRKMEPPWMDQVCVTSELIYKYQIITKSMEEVLARDLQKMKTLQQPSLVNEQLSQLYLDLQLEGVTSRLTLEEGITSSSSSGEENMDSATKSRRNNKEYSKLVMIYEENAPLPPPDSPPGPATF